MGRASDTMTTTMTEALDEARYVRCIDHGSIVTEMHIWQGGHTVNVYSHAQDHQEPKMYPVDCYSIGSFERSEVSQETAQEAIDARLERIQEEA